MFSFSIKMEELATYLFGEGSAKMSAASSATASSHATGMCWSSAKG